MGNVRVIFDINHPAHFHLFKNLIHHFNDHGIRHTIVSRDKEIVDILLKHEGFEFSTLTAPARTIPGLFGEMLKRNLAIYKKHRNERFTHGIGTSPSLAQLSLLTNIKSYNFCEDDDDIIPLQAMATYPFTTKIIVPDCLQYKRWIKKRITIPSYHELAYLHPDVFTPDFTVVESYGLKQHEYIIIRLSALNAHHDYGETGIPSDLLQEIRSVCSSYTIVESSELGKNYRVHPWHMHHILAGAKMIISDSQTMSAEAMVLGVPSIRVSSFVGRLSVYEELEKLHGLGFGYLPSDGRQIIISVKALLNNNNTASEWDVKRKRMLETKINMHQWMVDYFNEEFQCLEIT
jgi:uncharacterized protein